MQKGCFQILSVKYVSNLMAFLTTFMGILRFYFFIFFCCITDVVYHCIEKNCVKIL